MNFCLTTSRIVTNLIRAAFRGAALIRGEALIRERSLFQRGDPKLRRCKLFFLLTDQNLI